MKIKIIMYLYLLTLKNKYMKKTFFLLCISFNFACCSDNLRTVGELPIIDVINSVGKYQRTYCSDFFSSIELIPLETSEECLIDENYSLFLNDNFIIINDRKANSANIMASVTNLYAFNFSGKFINKIGERGQGPADYTMIFDVFLSPDKPSIYFSDFSKILEYNFDGRFIRSFRKPSPEGKSLSGLMYAGNNLFVGQVNYDGKNRFKYCLFNENGDTVKTFPSYVFFERTGTMLTRDDASLHPFRVDNRVYLKDYIIDTLYVLENSNLRPAFIFGLSKYSFSKERLENSNPQFSFPNHDFQILGIMGMPNYFFYQVRVPESFPRPKSKAEYNIISKQLYTRDAFVYGLYNIAENINILLDTDEHLQKGFINDLNGGLPFIPRYYAGNNIVADIWNVTDMQEILTDEYFTTQTIKDTQAHKKLKELLKNLKEDDNPVVVVAKLK